MEKLPCSAAKYKALNIILSPSLFVLSPALIKLFMLSVISKEFCNPLESSLNKNHFSKRKAAIEKKFRNPKNTDLVRKQKVLVSGSGFAKAEAGSAKPLDRLLEELLPK